ncbi:hypothetical protein CHUAL_006632 [Chamberlinius hualienensis]
MEPGLVRAPRPIRLGEPGYWAHLHSFYSRTSDEEEEYDSDNSVINLSSSYRTTEANRTCNNNEIKLHVNLAPTIPTYTDCLYTLDGQQRAKLPCECFNSNTPLTVLSSSCSSSKKRMSEFEKDDRLSTTNLIDWQTKESWMCDKIRNQVYSDNRWIKLCGSTDFRITASTSRTDLRVSTQNQEFSTDLGSLNANSLHGDHHWAWPATTSSIGYSEDSSSGFSHGLNDSPVLIERPSILLSPPLSPAVASITKSITNESRTFKCDHLNCTKQFSRKEELTRHKKTHCSERPFQCEICKRKFNRKDHMTKHQATHQDVSTRRRYFCPSPGCDRCYTRSDALSRHRSSAHSTRSNFHNFTHRQR